MPSRFLHELSRRILIFDGAMGTSIHNHDLDVHADYCGCENCTDILVRTRPDVIQSIHESFLEAGADVVETDTFRSNRLTLKEYGLHFHYERWDVYERALAAAGFAVGRPILVVKERALLGVGEPRARAVGLELDRRQRGGDPCLADRHGVSQDDALVGHDVLVDRVVANRRPAPEAEATPLMARRESPPRTAPPPNRRPPRTSGA